MLVGRLLSFGRALEMGVGIRIPMDFIQVYQCVYQCFIMFDFCKKCLMQHCPKLNEL